MTQFSLLGQARHASTLIDRATSIRRARAHNSVPWAFEKYYAVKEDASAGSLLRDGLSDPRDRKPSRLAAAAHRRFLTSMARLSGHVGLRN